MADYPNIAGATVALDSETTGLRWWKDEIFSFSLSVGDKDYYWDVRDEPQSLDWLANNIGSAAKIYMHNAKFDRHFFRETGVDLPSEKCVCTMVRACLINEHLPTYDLDFVGKKYLGVGKDGDMIEDMKVIFGSRLSRDALMKRLHEAPRRIVEKYAKQDTRTTLLLGLWQENEIELQGLHIVDKLERDLMPVFIDMERRGVRVNVEDAEKAVTEIDELCAKGQYRLNKEAGFEVNPNPSSSIHKLFAPKWEGDKWVLVDGTIAESTDAGKPSIDAACLRRMKHPLAAEILKLRKMMKARDTFLKGHILGHHDNGIIHCNINQTKGDNDAGTGTGRLSINSPALQQISARDKEIAAIVRAVFIPDVHCSWVSIDWAQVDFRVAAHYIKDPGVMESYSKNPETDFHQLAADLTGLPRSPRFAGDANAKQINLGMAFNMGAGKLAAEMGLPYTVEKVRGKEFYKPGPEALAVFERYHQAIPRFREFAAEATAVAKSRGYVKSLLGRHMRFPDTNFAYKASGLLYQSGAAEMQKIKILECHKLADELGSRLMLSVHDELNFSVPVGDDLSIKKINEAYCDFSSDAARIKLRIPIKSSVGVGENWWEASK
jgi:DNA polymerase I-like protein with 3'-5' exonuclease and polymerase domains